MASFTLIIDTDNAAFDPDPEIEIARVLRTVAKQVGAERLAAYSESTENIRDLNGNTIGRWSYKKLARDES